MDTTEQRDPHDRATPAAIWAGLSRAEYDRQARSEGAQPCDVDGCFSLAQPRHRVFADRPNLCPIHQEDGA